MDLHNNQYEGMPEGLKKYLDGCTEENLIMENFYHPFQKPIVFTYWNNNLYKKNISWSNADMADARSDNPEHIFRYYIDIMRLNMLFFWLEDGCMYNIATEKKPITVCRYRPRTTDKKVPIVDRFGEAHSCSGIIDPNFDELVATFSSDRVDLWNQLRINCIPIGDVLKRSVIIELD